MTIPRPDRSLRNLKRYRKIAAILVKYGFGEIVSRLNLLPRFGSHREHESIGRMSSPVRVRLALEELGPTFVKLGQVISTRPFLLPLEYIDELSKLQDQVEPMTWDATEEVLTDELGTDSLDNFKSFEKVPFASASMAQVHNAVLKDGTPVVIKIQRQGIKKVIASDMRILHDIADMLDHNIPESRQFDPCGLVEELSRSTQKEIDFLNEAHNIEIFANNFKDEPGIKIPGVYREFSTSRVLVLEKIEGIKISKIDRIREAGYDLEKICLNGSRLVLKMIFEDGFFHADPHPGNLFVCPGDIIAPVDFGMMGTLSESQMNELAEMIVTVSSRDAAAIVRLLQNMEVLPEEAKTKQMEHDLSELIVRYYQIPLERIDMRTAIDDFFMLVSRYRVKFQAEFMLLGKALVTYEEVARALNPGFNFFEAMLPYIKKLARKKYEPERFFKDVQRITDELRWLLVESPHDWRQISTKLKRGELQLVLQHRGLERLIRELDSFSNRLSVSMLIAALIVGSSLIMTIDKGYMIFDVPILGLMGYSFAAILGILLVVSILRSGRF